MDPLHQAADNLNAWLKTASCHIEPSIIKKQHARAMRLSKVRLLGEHRSIPSSNRFVSAFLA